MKKEYSFICGILLFEIIWITWLFWGEPGLFESYDYVHYHQYMLEYLREAYLDFRIPFWNPHIAMGMPFAAYVEPSVFYPVNWILWLLPVRAFVVFSLIFHGLLGYCSLVLLARKLGVHRFVSLIVPFLFFFGSAVLLRVQMGHINYVNSLCYWPLIFLLAVRLMEEKTVVRFSLLTLGFCLQILCGHVQVVWMGCFAIGALITGMSFRSLKMPELLPWLRIAFYISAALVLSCALVGFLLFPLWEMSQQSTRAAVGSTGYNYYPMAPLHFRTLFPLNPPIRLGPEAQSYPGVLCLILGLSGLSFIRKPAVRGLMLVIVISTFLGYAIYSPGFEFWKTLVPGYGMFRIHARFLVLIVFSLSICAGIFITECIRDRSNYLRLLAPALTFPLIIFTSHTLADDHLETLAGWRATYYFLLILLVLFTLILNHRKRLSALIVLIILLAFINFYDVLSYSKNAWGMWSHAETLKNKDAIAQIEALEPSQEYSFNRISAPPDVINPNAAVSLGYVTPYFYTPISMFRLYHSLSSFYELKNVSNLGVYVDSRIHHFDLNMFPGTALDYSYDRQEKAFIKNERRAGRHFLSSEWMILPSWNAILEQERQLGPSVDRTVFLETNPGLPDPTSPQGAYTLNLVKETPESLVFETMTDQDSVLVLSESYYPGWKARIDNNLTSEAFPVNIWMRGVFVPKGSHQVEVFYDPETFREGLRLSFIGLVVLCGMLFLSNRRKESKS